MVLFFSVVSTSGIPDSLRWLNVVFMVAVTDCEFREKIITKRIYIHICMYVGMYVRTYVPSKSWTFINTSSLRGMPGVVESRRGRESCCTCVITVLNYAVLLDVTIQSWDF